MGPRAGYAEISVARLLVFKEKRMRDSRSSNAAVAYRNEVLLAADAFVRDDETPDDQFYARDRFVNHLDAVALNTVKKVIEQLVVEEQPVILDLMAGWNSHLPAGLRSARVVGLGLNAHELAQNEVLSHRVLHDLNENPMLPFEDGIFDVVINTVSVDYMTKPLEVFREVARILKPGGLFLVIFSNRMFPRKATRVWKESSEEERVLLVEEFFNRADRYENIRVFMSKGKPRPADDKYAHLGIPSDPIYVVYADRKCEEARHEVRPEVTEEQVEVLPPEQLDQRVAAVKDTLCCPHCGDRLRKWQVPYTPFTTWDTDYLYICFNDTCPYLMRGFGVMNRQGNRGVSYRLMYNPRNNCCMPVPVPSLTALRESIVG
jgi:SAM-dependent methyltransferase